MSRTVLVEHHGQPILRLDCAGRSLDDLESALSSAAATTGAAERGDARVLVVWTTPLSAAEARLLRARLSAAAPGAAIVFPRPVQKVFFDSMTGELPSHVATFDDESAGRDWLISDGATRGAAPIP